jgi:CBS domain containing-hemolysin-like protein
MNRSRARSLRDADRRGARALVGLVERPENFLNTVLLFVLICQLVSATLVGILAGHLFGAAGVIVATVVEVIVIFTLFEAIPKNLAVEHPDSAALVSAPVVAALVGFPPLKWISSSLHLFATWAIALAGVRGSGSQVTESEVMALADVAHEENVIEEEERDFIRSVFEFGDTIVREVMVPRPDIVDVAHDAPVREALEISIQTGRSRLPVLGDGGIDDVVGIVNLRNLARLVGEGHGDDFVERHLGEAHFVPETKKVAALLRQIREGNNHLFVVVDEYGGTVGLVTLEDVLEELVGEITDESDPDDDEVAVVEGRGLVVSGRLNIDDVNEEYDLELPTGSWDTVGGLVMDLAGGVPEPGEVFEVGPYRLVVERLDGRRVEEVLVEKGERS